MTAHLDSAPSFAPGLIRLRRQLMAASVLVTLLGLAALAWLVVRIDEEARTDRRDAELETRATAARSLLYYEHGVLKIDGLLDDSAINGAPQVFAVEIDGSVAFDHSEREFDLDLAFLAQQTTASDSQVLMPVTDRRGLGAQVFGETFYHDETDEIAGAVLVVGDASIGSATHRRTVRVVWLGSAALAGILALAAWQVINRSLAPAAVALAQQERFVADAAHELRRPFTSLRATADRGLRGGSPEESLERMIMVLDDTSAMVDDLLVLAQLDATDHRQITNTSPVRLDQLVESTLDGIANVTVETASPVIVNIDPALVARAATNMVDNALQHGKPPVVVMVEPGQIRVLDRGPGFTDVDAKSSFARFRPGPASSGFGLGLPLIASVARVHGGSVEVTNRADGPGAEIVLKLP